VSTIRIYMMNGHNLSNIAKSLEEFERELSAALAREHGKMYVEDTRGFRHLIVADKVSHASADAS
jgi:hypothetical protein